MAISSYIVALLCMTTAIHCIDADLYIVTPNLRVSEDVGSVFINISSRGTVERKAYLLFISYGAMDYEFPTINETSRIFNFTISPGTTRSFEVVIVDDSIVERRKRVLYYSLYVYGFTGIDYIGGRNILIEDNDGAYFTPESAISRNEDVGNVPFCVNYTSRDDLPQTVNVSVNSRPDDDQDLIFNEDGVSFILMGTSSICFDMLIIDDEENELPEFLFLDLYFYNGSLIQLIDTLVIVLYDNEEAAYIGFEKTTYSVLESDGMVNVCLTVDRGDGTEEFEVYLYIANLTTQGVTDHEVEPYYGPVTFLVDDIIQCVNINITDDKIEEDTEFFQIFLYYYQRIFALHGNPKIYPLSSNARATITIYDDDLTCVPECVNGECRDPRVCVCDDGYTGEDCSQEPATISSPSETPTPDPTPDPSPEPSPEPTPDPTPDPSPEPTPDPTPDPSPEPSPEPTPDPSITDPCITDPPSASDNTTAIVGGLVVAVILIIAITVTVIAAMVLKSRRYGDAPIKNAPEKHELSVLPGSPVKDVSITTSANAYEMMKQGLGVESEGYEVIDVLQRGGPTMTGVEAAYEVPSVTDQPLPDTPSPLCKTGQEKDDEEDGVYETIPGDN